MRGRSKPQPSAFRFSLLSFIPTPSAVAYSSRAGGSVQRAYPATIRTETSQPVSFEGRPTLPLAESDGTLGVYVNLPSKSVYLVHRQIPILVETNKIYSVFLCPHPEKYDTIRIISRRWPRRGLATYSREIAIKVLGSYRFLAKMNTVHAWTAKLSL